jgi:hypothetical protein
MSETSEDVSSDSSWQRNIEAVAEWDPWQWSSWFLAASADRDFAPVEIHPQARLTAEVAELYRNAGEKVRFAMRRGIVEALRTWTLDDYGDRGFAILNQLCWIVEKVRSTEAIPILLHILGDHRDLLPRDRKALSAADNLISIVGGFPPDRAMEDVFSDLLLDDSTPPQLTSLLAVTIASASPSRFAQCLDRYVAMSERAPADFFNHPSVVKSFKAAVPSVAINKGLEYASPRAWVYWMVHGVEGEEIERGELFGFDVEGRTDIQDETLAPPQEQTFDVLSEMYEHAQEFATTPKLDVELPPDAWLTVVESEQLDADNLAEQEEDADPWAPEESAEAVA